MNKITNHIMIYAVSLKERIDRQEKLLSQIHPHTPLFSFSLQEKGRYIVGKNAQVYDWRIDSDNQWWNREMKLGEIDCFLSHLACWENAKSHQEVKYFLFLEDDVIVPNFNIGTINHILQKLSEQHADWDMLYLGREKLENDIFDHNFFVVPGFSYCTYSYILSRKGLDKLLNYHPQKKIIPLDEFLPATYLKHPRHDIAKSIPPSINAFALKSEMAYEGPKEIYGSDTENSPYFK
ncbi:glycosyltransferase family 25 protein [Massilia sp. W12]|uniref:glycosyltransferase family 25 protein n=1 Tax=Massilia sp. W12 TaxID=3126507 RepID=UPI0030D5FC7D